MRDIEPIDYNIEQLWEERSRRYGTKSEGVLPKSLPVSINESLHQWMCQQIELGIKDQPGSWSGQKLKILDVGCGYGRLSSRILHEFPKARTYGVDLAQHYVDLYNKNLRLRGQAVKGDIRKLPFTKNTFDLVFVVTTLMYVIKKSEQEKAIKECLRVLKPSGRFVTIERNPTGYSIFTLGGLVTKLRGKEHAEIPSVSFSPGKMTTLIKDSGGKIITVRAIPVWTLCLPLFVFLSYLSGGLARWFLRIIAAIDAKFDWLLTPSLYISYTCTKLK